jgi:hypothetical protein
MPVGANELSRTADSSLGPSRPGHTLTSQTDIPDDPLDRVPQRFPNGQNHTIKPRERPTSMRFGAQRRASGRQGGWSACVFLCIRARSSRLYQNTFPEGHFAPRALSTRRDPIIDPAKNLKTVEQRPSNRRRATSAWCATSPRLDGMDGVYCQNRDIAPQVSRELATNQFGSLALGVSPRGRSAGGGTPLESERVLTW